MFLSLKDTFEMCYISNFEFSVLIAATKPGVLTAWGCQIAEFIHRWRPTLCHHEYNAANGGNIKAMQHNIADYDWDKFEQSLVYIFFTWYRTVYHREMCCWVYVDTKNWQVANPLLPKINAQLVLTPIIYYPYSAKSIKMVTISVTGAGALILMRI